MADFGGIWGNLSGKFQYVLICASQMDKDWLTDSQSLSNYVNRIGQRLANIREFSSYVIQSLFNSVYIIGQRLANLAEYCMIMML